MQSNQLKTISLWTIFLSIAAVSALYFISTETERFKSPDGKYEVVGYERLFWRFVPTMPGQGSDSPREVEIVSSAGESMGKIEVPIGSMMSAIEWTEHGAEIRAVGAWDFEKGTAYYWSEDGNGEVWTKGHGM